MGNIDLTKRSRREKRFVNVPGFASSSLAGTLVDKLLIAATRRVKALFIRALFLGIAYIFLVPLLKLVFISTGVTKVIGLAIQNIGFDPDEVGNIIHAPTDESDTLEIFAWHVYQSIMSLDVDS